MNELDGRAAESDIPAVVRAVVDYTGPGITVYLGTRDAAALPAAESEAGHAARELGLPESVRAQLLETLGTAVPQLANTLAPALAIFAAQERLWAVPLHELHSPGVTVSDRFRVAPLLAGQFVQARPVVLALSQNAVRVIDASVSPARLVEVPGMPVDLRDFERLDLTGDRETLAHLRTSEEPTVRQREYVRAVHRALRSEFMDSGILLIVAATEPLSSLFREIAHDMTLASRTIVGNPDAASIRDLALAANDAIVEYRQAMQQGQRERLTEFPDRRRVTTDPAHALLAASRGALDTLIIDFTMSEPAVPDGVDETAPIIEEAARAAYDSGAQIVAAAPRSLPDAAPIAAILRYPIEVPAGAGA